MHKVRWVWLVSESVWFETLGEHIDGNIKVFATKTNALRYIEKYESNSNNQQNHVSLEKKELIW